MYSSRQVKKNLKKLEHQKSLCHNLNLPVIFKKSYNIDLLNWLIDLFTYKTLIYYLLTYLILIGVTTCALKSRFQKKGFDVSLVHYNERD